MIKNINLATLLIVLCSICTLLRAQKIDLYTIAIDSLALEKNAFDALVADKRAVFIGENHLDGNAYQSKVDIIKYLHEEHGFNAIAFEASFFATYTAQKQIEEGLKVDKAFVNCLYNKWCFSEEVAELAEYLEKNPEISIYGFDPQWGGNSYVYYVDSLNAYLDQKNILNNEDQRKKLNKLIDNCKARNFQKIKKKDIININIIDSCLVKVNDVSFEDRFWKRSLTNLKCYIKENIKREDYYFRDSIMAENFLWLMKEYPDKRFMCWGATSHFMRNTDKMNFKKKRFNKGYINYKVMGEFLNDTIPDDFAVVGVTGVKGELGLSLVKRKFKAPRKNSIEDIYQSDVTQMLIPKQSEKGNAWDTRMIGYTYLLSDPIFNRVDALIISPLIYTSKINWDLLEQYHK